MDGIVFHSAKEARRYQELKLLEKAGEIHGLELQPSFPLLAPTPRLLALGNGLLPAATSMETLGLYRADFVYCECGRPNAERHTKRVVEDVKGFKTPLYRWKKKHVEAQYGIRIVEV